MVAVYEDLAHLAADRREELAEAETKSKDVTESEAMLDEIAHKLGEALGLQVTAAEETSKLIKDLTTAVREIAQHVETLASSAEESSRPSSR